jgi:hypothetical protein
MVLGSGGTRRPGEGLATSEVHRQADGQHYRRNAACRLHHTRQASRKALTLQCHCFQLPSQIPRDHLATPFDTSTTPQAYHDAKLRPCIGNCHNRPPSGATCPTLTTPQGRVAAASTIAMARATDTQQQGASVTSTRLFRYTGPAVPITRWGGACG